MNAAEQAKSFEAVSKIAALVSLFKSEFAHVSIDLNPWQNDPDTQELVDPDSIDLGLHFPGRSGSYQSRCILVQIRFYCDPVEGQRRALGIEAMGYDHRGQQWRFSTVEHWQFSGTAVPSQEAKEKFKRIFQRVLELFNNEF